MAVITQRTNMAPGLGTALGEGLTQGYEQEADRRALQNAIGRLPPDAKPQDVLNALLGTKASPEAKQNVFKNYLGAAEFQAKQDEVTEAKQKELQRKIELKRKEDESARRFKITSGQRDRDLEIKEDKAAEVKPDEFQKTYEKKIAEEYFELPTEIAKLDDTIADIEAVEKLSQSMGLGSNVLSAAGLSAKSKEMEALSFTLMQPIVKMFNPTGPIAQKKLETIQNKYVLSGTEPEWLRQSKINALRRFAVQAKKRAEGRMKVIENYRNDPKRMEGKLKEYDKESETISDAMTDYDLVGEEVNIPGLPPPATLKDRTITGPDGSKYFSDGHRWVKK